MCSAQKTESAHQIVDQATDGYGKECSGNAEGQPPCGCEGIQNNSERNQPGRGGGKDLHHREEGEQCDSEPAQRSEKPRLRDVTAHPISEERKHDLENADDHERGHAHLPGKHGVLCLEIYGAEHGGCNSDSGWSVEAKRHGGDVGPACPLCEPEGKPGVDCVAEEDPESRAGYHEAVNLVDRISEYAHKNPGEDHKVGNVVQH